MSVEGLDSGGVQIVDTILSEADSHARRILDDADLSAQEELQKARKEGEKFRDEVLAKAREASNRLEVRELATARIDAKRLLLKAREDLISRIFGQIEERLSTIRRDKVEYPKSLRILAKEAVLAISEAEIILRFSKTDAGLLSDVFTKDIAAAAREQRGYEPKLTVRFDDEDNGGGCIAQSVDGRVVYDNTFRTRLERDRREIRSMIVEEFTKNHG